MAMEPEILRLFQCSEEVALVAYSKHVIFLTSNITL
eukprot:CAMPEP_0202949568 /NCGR_PEP_ID=MMETSP1395-20130829/16306_1 /ASSEMBLY_ACC=CAM_ASM_000871 /TAXON_ID=5961 /ORGANISM="Blepharisma japonicum, Strain Stock R1072" /LENGTH=35 /DNA_ID= /DNA_START= /DNA_END= /DNA_ORIENTATION=